jgi:glycosyltransferase involved in cell wall biosynthesis
MKILQLCPKPPFPQMDGGCIAMNNITWGLIHQGHEVKVLTINTPKHPVIQNEEYQKYIQSTHFESVFVDTTIKWHALLKALIFNYSYNVHRFDSKYFHQKLIEILKKETFDIVQLETIYMAPYIQTIQNHSHAKVVLRLHNIEHKIWERLVQNEKSFLKKSVLKRLTSSLMKYEISQISKVDAYLTISNVDYNYFHTIIPKTNGITIPFGINMEEYIVNDDYIPSKEPVLFHIGSMDWLPNIEGIEWFLNEVWPLVIEKHPNIHFVMAGRNIPESFKIFNSKNFSIAGEVPDAKKFILSHDIMIVPLHSGSGVRIKIIEAMALGKTIITTPVGAEGLDVTDGKNIYIAHTIEEMVEKISDCIKTPEVCKIIGENARNYVTLQHHNNSITDKIISFFNSLIHEKTKSNESIK